MSDQAIRPDFFGNLVKKIEKQEPEHTTTDLLEEERHYYNLAQQKGYQQLQDYADRLIATLDTATATAMAQGLDFEEIGRNAVVVDLAKGIITRIFERVEDAREACEQADGIK